MKYPMTQELWESTVTRAWFVATFGCDEFKIGNTTNDLPEAGYYLTPDGFVSDLKHNLSRYQERRRVVEWGGVWHLVQTLAMFGWSLDDAIDLAHGRRSLLENESASFAAEIDLALSERRSPV